MMDAKQHDFFLWFETTFADLTESTGLNKFIREHPIPMEPDGPDPSNPTPPIMEQDLMLELRDKVWNWVNEAHRSQDSNQHLHHDADCEGDGHECEGAQRQTARP